MPLLGGLLAVLGAVVFILWRLQQASRATRDIAEAADDLRGLARGWSWRRRANVNPLDQIDDPREAASVLMAVVAQSDGMVSERERGAILEEMQAKFGASAAQAEELLARARWLVKDATDPAEIMRRLERVVRDKLGAAERRELIDMLDKVALADGRRDESIDRDIRGFAKRLTGGRQAG